MIVGSIKEDRMLEKRVSLTPESAKNIIGLGLKLCIEKEYALHLGINDNEFKDIGVTVSGDEKEIINSADIIVQLGLLAEDRNSLIKDNKTLIGVLNPHSNEEKIKNLVKLFQVFLWFWLSIKCYF